MGGLRISGDGDDRRIFKGMQFSIPGFFGKEYLARIFMGWLVLSRDFGGIQNNLRIRGSARV